MNAMCTTQLFLSFVKMAGWWSSSWNMSR